jgi:hypothetical protein
MSRKLTFMSVGLIVLASVAGIWRLHAIRVQSPSLAANSLLARSAAASVVHHDHGDSVSARDTQWVVAIDPRAERRKATDYRQLVNLLLPLAKTGSAAAQYEVASALRYCKESWHAHIFSATGAARTPEEMRQLYANLPANTQSLLNEADQRCHSFLSDVNLLNSSNDWLDRADKAGYPPAIFMKADLMMVAHLKDGDGAAVLRAGQLISAWWLLGCEKGYDCGPESDAMKGICTVDPQCANKPGFVENLERINGAKFGEVQQLAEQIKAAVESGDQEEIKNYL